MRRNMGYEQLSYCTGGPSIAEGDSKAIEYSRCAPATGKGRKSSASIRRKDAVQAPMARASDRTAAAEVTFFLRICRQPKTASARRESSHGMRRRSRLSSRRRSAEPSARRASAGSRSSSMASSTCDRSSSSISRLKRPPRRVLVMRDQSDMSDRPQHTVYGGGHLLPARFLAGELVAALGGESIDAQAASLVRGGPFGAEPSGFLHAVKRGIERTLVGAQDVAGAVFDGGHDGVAVDAGLAGQDLQHEEVERPLEGVTFGHIETSQYSDG